MTEKGRGYAPAENDEADLMHSTGIIDPVTGKPVFEAQPGWTSVFSKELLKAGRERNDIVAITAAMAGPTGLDKFGAEFPDRFFDVGIAEQHAITSAAGLALGGVHPVVAVYSTFLNRAFDQLLMDVALLRLPLTLVLDRAGITGSDGASHNGVWDLSILSIIPGMRVAAPRDGEQLRTLFREALAINDGPTAVRFPKGSLPPVHQAVETYDDGVEVLFRSEAPSDTAVRVALVSVGAFAETALAAAASLDAVGYAVTVVDPRWVVPVAESIVQTASEHDMVVTLEDGVIHGGVGSLLSEALSAVGIDTPLRHLAVPEEFLDHASRSEILHDQKLDAEGVAQRILDWLQQDRS